MEASRMKIVQLPSGPGARQSPSRIAIASIDARGAASPKLRALPVWRERRSLDGRVPVEPGAGAQPAGSHELLGLAVFPSRAPSAGTPGA